MSNSLRKLSFAAIVAASATSLVAIDLAEANGTKRQRTRDGIMRLGAPTNGNGASTNVGFVDRTNGPSFRTQADVRAFSLQRFERGGGPN
jgi:hypothetical protein